MKAISALPDSKNVAHAFSQAAKNYDDVAGLQRLAADKLLLKSKNAHFGDVLDIGSGTGYVSSQLASIDNVDSVTGLDIAEGMLERAKVLHHSTKLSWQLGDAQHLMAHLPDCEGHYDLVISSLAIQWCQNLDAVFEGVANCLKDDGVFYCATLGPDTLYQLKWAWSQVDDYQHVNDFVGAEQVRASLENYFSDIEIEQEPIQLEFPTVQQLINGLKKLGASNRNTSAAQGLTSAGKLRKMIDAYETLRGEDGLLPVTYDVIYITAKPRVSE